MKGALLLIAAGALLSLLIFRGASAKQLLATLESQPTVYSWDAKKAGERLNSDLLVVDGRRRGHRGIRPKDALSIPFEERRFETFVLPEGHEVRAVLVVMEASRSAEARELAQDLAREWAMPEVATLKGGIEAWQAAGLPVETR